MHATELRAVTSNLGGLISLNDQARHVAECPVALVAGLGTQALRFRHCVISNHAKYRGKRRSGSLSLESKDDQSVQVAFEVPGLHATH